MISFAKAVTAAAVLLCLGSRAGWSQVKVVTPECSISFGSGWALFDSANLALAKDEGAGGIALLRSWRENNGAPFDSAAENKSLGDSLEAKVTLTKDETKTLGAHAVRILTLSYDTLRRVERVAREHGRNNTFRNGSLKVYIVRSGGVRVNIIGIYAVPILTPFASIEQAIPSLAMVPTGIAGRAGTAGASWSVVSGKLRFAGAAPLEVSVLDGMGRRAGLAERAAGGAEWNLPSAPGPLFLTARFPGRVIPLGRIGGRP